MGGTKAVGRAGAQAYLLGQGDVSHEPALFVLWVSGLRLFLAVVLVVAGINLHSFSVSLGSVCHHSIWQHEPGRMESKRWIKSHAIAGFMHPTIYILRAKQGHMSKVPVSSSGRQSQRQGLFT